MEEVLAMAPEIISAGKEIYNSLGPSGSTQRIKTQEHKNAELARSQQRNNAHNVNRGLDDVIEAVASGQDPAHAMDDTAMQTDPVINPFQNRHTAYAADQAVSPPKVNETGAQIVTKHVVVTQHTIDSGNFYYLGGCASPIPFLEANNIQKMVKYWPETTALEVKDTDLEISNVFILDSKQDTTTGQINTGLVQRGKICLFEVTNTNHNPFQLGIITDVVRQWNVDYTYNSIHGYFYKLDYSMNFQLCDWDETGNIGNRKIFPARGENFGHEKRIDNGDSISVCRNTERGYTDWRGVAVFERPMMMQDRPLAYLDTSILDQIPQLNDPLIEPPFSRNSQAGLIGFTSGSLPGSLLERMMYVETFGMVQMHSGEGALWPKDTPTTSGDWAGSGGYVRTHTPPRIDLKLSSRFPPFIFGGDTPTIRLPITTNLNGCKVGKRCLMASHFQYPSSTSYYSINEIGNSFLISCPLMPLGFFNTDAVTEISLKNGVPETVTRTAADIAAVPYWPSYHNPLIKSGDAGERQITWNHMGHQKQCKPLKHYFMCMQTIKDTSGNIMPMAANFQLVHRMTTIQHLNNVFYDDIGNYNLYKWRMTSHTRDHANNSKFTHTTYVLPV